MVPINSPLDVTKEFPIVFSHSLYCKENELAIEEDIKSKRYISDIII